jgi:predicted aspartyl protease
VRRACSTLIAAMLALPAPLIANPPAEPAAEASVITTGEDRAMRMTVPVMINGQGPFNFVIDTGADRTVISQALATRLNLPDGGKAKLHAMGGSADVRTVKIATLSVSTNVHRNIKAAALPERYLGADGMLGVDSLKNQRIVMDFRAQTLRLEPSSTPEEIIKDGSTIIVSARTKLGQLVMVDADANGEKLWVVVDTGAQNTVGNSRLKRTLSRNLDPVAMRQIEMIDVIGRRTPASYTIVDKIRIGGVQMGNAAVAFADAHPFRLFGLDKKPSMLLGMESLRSFRRVSVDFSTRKVKFHLNDTGKASDDHLLTQAATSPAT